MTNSKHVPKRRFSGFEEAWYLIALEEIAKITMGQSPNGETYSDTPNDYILVQGNADLVEGWVKPRLWTTQVTKRADKGDIIMSVRAPAGEVGRTNYDVVIGRGVAAIKGNDFIFQRLIKMNLDGYWKSLSAGSTFESLNSDDIKRAIFKIPSIHEQEYIGRFFETLDSFISLHQHKLDKLKDLKKAYLTEMFPAEGERVPKRRFPGFEGEWEQKRLATIASMHARIGWQNLRTSEFLNDGDYYLITGTDFLDGRINFDNCYYVDKERYQQDKNIQVKTGSILITKDGTIGKVAIVGHLDKPATLNAGVFNVVIKESNVDEKYLYQYLASPFLMDYVLKRVTGGTIKHLNQGILVDFPINIPTYEEQKAIGKFFEHLDQSITLQQQKLDKLNDLKKAYLNELFV